ncbi:uncharacterized protein M421DRAFT_376615 [Didymella exigua CBS 183.55]|uniref:Uncharacterized protein n=1 Tax=Didymella exigua CBS 183.55 TaxID=1150837 RepID=A0A6A5RU51_9PLEO|nr:uncharacterized protein M421DRAFT_376615 [Didymella exigua CBS 183.55]KAF1930548.1 hypothetical protein M421DRAFT_376615 [Didymella exigua CBS 183.55]
MLPQFAHACVGDSSKTIRLSKVGLKKRLERMCQAKNVLLLLSFQILRREGAAQPLVALPATPWTLQIISSVGNGMKAPCRSSLKLSRDTISVRDGLLRTLDRHNFTKTFHSLIPSDIDPRSVTLPDPFIVMVTGAGKGLGYTSASPSCAQDAAGSQYHPEQAPISTHWNPRSAQLHARE